MPLALLVVNRVRVDDPAEIGSEGLDLEELDPAMEHDLMKEEVSYAVECHSQTHAEHRPYLSQAAPRGESHGHACEEESEEVVLLKDRLRGSVVVLVENPEKAMHHILVRDQGDEFHACGTDNHDEGIG